MLKKLLTLFFICLIRLIAVLVKFFYRFGGRFILLWLYRLYSFLKQEFKRGLAPLQNKLYYYLGNRHLIHFIIIALAIFVAVSNIKAYDNRNADLLAIEKESLISRLVPKSPEEIESFELIEEEVVIDSKGPKRVCRYFDIEGVAKAEPQLVDKSEEAEDWTKISLKEDTLLKPQIVTTAEDEEFYPYTRTSIESYVVKSGDTLSSIAKRFGISVETILWENNLSIYSTLQPGQKLAILPASGLTYKVKKGDTVEKIAKNFKIDSDKILVYNNLSDGGLKIGQTIIIPDARKIITQPKASSPLGAIKKYYEAPAPRNILGFVWPTTCRRITQYYSWRHHAVDIACGYNVAIYAVESGVVESACWVRGYGKRIIIVHPNGMRTLYGHLNQFNVTAGQTIKKGQVIGLMGSTGRSTGAHVHFEVMAGRAKQNPLRYY